jgi:hypothetical protein
MAKRSQVLWTDCFSLERPRWLKILKANTLQVLLGGKSLNTVCISLVGSLVIPELVFAAIRENHERRSEIFCVTTSLLFGVVRIELFPLCLEDTQDTAQIVLQEIVGPTICDALLKLDLLGVQQIPPTQFKGAVD